MECGRENLDAIVSTTVRSAGVTGMQVTLIQDVKKGRPESSLQPFAQAGFAVAAAHQACPGCACLILPLSQRACGITKTNVAALMPNTLKLTQTPSAKLRAM